MKLLSRRPYLAAALALSVLVGLGPARVPQTMPADEIIASSIAFHDPQELWANGSFRLELIQTRPIGGYTEVELIIDNSVGRFWMRRERLGRVVETTVTGDQCWTKFNGSSEYTEQEAERFGLDCEAMRTTRDYYTYLYGLPMKLRDEGTIIDPGAKRDEFEGTDAWEIRVTYDPEVGTDTWYFYFSPDDYSLIGYRFYHDEAANDGEYIVLDRLQEGDLRLPKVRSWFTHAEDRLVGTDKIMALERISRDR